MNAGSEKIWYLQRLNLFAGMAPAEIEMVSRDMRERRRRRGETILGPRSAGDRIYLVKSGLVRVYQFDLTGREVTTGLMRPGQLFGTSSLIGVGKQPAFAEAMEDAEICEMAAEEFLAVVKSHPQFAAQVIIAMARQFLGLEQQMARLLSEGVHTRLARVLLQLADSCGGQLPPKLTHADLAGLVGTSRETVTRVLAQFAERGLVTIGYRKLAIADPEALRREAGLEYGDGATT
jgi:CRP-like cAMP-binding protein